MPWKGAASIGLLLLLLLFDRVEYPLFGDPPSRRVGLSLIAIRLILSMGIFAIMDPWENALGLLMLALVPYMAYLYLGSRGGIAVGAIVWVIGVSMLVTSALPHLTRIAIYKGDEVSTEYNITASMVQTVTASLTLLTILIVFVLVSARITALELAHTSRTKQLLAQLESCHARLDTYSRRAIAISEENKRTARDIHDGLAHHLTAVSLQIDLALAYRDIGPEKADEAIKSAKAAISKSLQDVRRSVGILRAKREVAPSPIPEDDHEPTREVESTSRSEANNAKGWLSWLFPHPFNIIATALYIGIFVMGSIEEDTIASPGTMLALAGLLLGLAVLDRAEFAFFRERPAWWVGLLLVALRIAIAYEIFVGLEIWYAILMIAIIPYWFTIYFGTRTGYITAALLVITVGFFSLGIPLEQVLSAPLYSALGAYLGTILLLAFVLGIVAATSSTVVKEGAARAGAEKVLTELRKTYTDLAHFSRQAIEAGEARNSLARDIHDGLGHYLTAMSVQLEKALAFRSIDPAGADRALNESKRLVAVALQEIRSTVGALRESETDLSPVKALSDLAKYPGYGSLKVQLNIQGDESGYSRQVLMAIYRAAQEGLTNVQKHSGAAQVAMNLDFGENVATLQIKDNGRGFLLPSSQVSERTGEATTVHEPQTGTGYGLQSMRERLELLGGDLHVESTPGAGTTLYISVPRRSTVQVESRVAFAAKSNT